MLDSRCLVGIYLLIHRIYELLAHTPVNAEETQGYLVIGVEIGLADGTQLSTPLHLALLELFGARSLTHTIVAGPALE